MATVVPLKVGAPSQSGNEPAGFAFPSTSTPPRVQTLRVGGAGSTSASDPQVVAGALVLQADPLFRPDLTGGVRAAAALSAARAQLAGQLSPADALANVASVATTGQPTATAALADAMAAAQAAPTPPRTFLGMPIDPETGTSISPLARMSRGVKYGLGALAIAGVVYAFTRKG